MSRIARKSIPIPTGVTVDLKGGLLRVKGPKGELSQKLDPRVKLSLDDGALVSVPNPKDRNDKMNWGTAASMLRSMIKGVTEGFERVLEINGVGYRAELKGKNIHLSLGHSHPVVFALPAGVSAQVPQPTQIILSGSDFRMLGQTAASIRAVRPVEPYKGKGVRYADEHVIRKEGKKAGK